MRPKFDIHNFELLNNRDILLECEFCNKEFISTKKYIRRVLSGNGKNSLKYCSRICSYEGKRTGKYVKCSICDKSIYRANKEINKNDIFYCSGKCRGIDFNRNKNYGGNRSKIELFVEEELINRYNFDISFNDRKILNNSYELDIYIPILKLAFELNGIFHYEPIFGDEKLKITKGKDFLKIDECINRNIELIVIDITDIKQFNNKQGLKYLNYIISEIDSRIDVDKYLLKGLVERKIIEDKKIKRCECGIEIKIRSLKCRSCSNKSKHSNRPTYVELKKDILDLGYKRVGEKYKVDRTTIYKWIRKYEIENTSVA